MPMLSLDTDNILDLTEAKQVIMGLKQDKETLEQEIQSIKEKAVNSIIAKEKQIIDLMSYSDEQKDDLKREISRL